MKFLMFVILAFFIGFSAWGVYKLINERENLSAEVEVIRKEVDFLKSENLYLAREIEYFKNPKNLLKELKSQFNYKTAGENLVIIVPPEYAEETEATSTAP